MQTVHVQISEQELQNILNAHGATDAYVFGSFARGEATAQSDLDLLVTYRPGTTLFDIADLQNELEKALDRKVDLVSRKHLSKRLASRIEKDIKPVSSIL